MSAYRICAHNGNGGFWHRALSWKLMLNHYFFIFFPRGATHFEGHRQLCRSWRRVSQRVEAKNEKNDSDMKKRV